MKKLLILLSLFNFIETQAQQKEGKITYSRKTQIKFSIGSSQGAQPIEQEKTDKFELNFANNQLALHQLPEDIQEETTNNFSSGGGQIVLRTSGSTDDKVFYDLTTKLKTESKEFLGKTYLISDSVRMADWKLSNESKTILGFNCQKATRTHISVRNTMFMQNGVMERKEQSDTSIITAWFTSAIPVAGGPTDMGQLPGMILELEMNNGKIVYTAIEIKDKANKKLIKEPTKGKKVTAAEFLAERKKAQDEMQQNPRSFQMRIN